MFKALQLLSCDLLFQVNVPLSVNTPVTAVNFFAGQSKQWGLHFVEDNYNPLAFSRTGTLDVIFMRLAALTVSLLLPVSHNLHLPAHSTS